jgi:hypothetical protein
MSNSGRVLTNKDRRSDTQIIVATPRRLPRGRPTSDEQPPDEQSAQWLENLLPEATNGSGWWEVRAKPKGFMLRFRWRDPNPRVLTVESITRGQLETPKQTVAEGTAKGRIRETQTSQQG